MPLNHDGDEIYLIDRQGNIVDHVRYSAEQVVCGHEVVFEQGVT